MSAAEQLIESEATSKSTSQVEDIRTYCDDKPFSDEGNPLQLPITTEDDSEIVWLSPSDDPYCFVGGQSIRPLLPVMVLPIQRAAPKVYVNLDRNQIPVNSEMKPMNGRENFIFKHPYPVAALKQKNQGNVQPIVPSKVQKVQNSVHNKITTIQVNAGMEPMKSRETSKRPIVSAVPRNLNIRHSTVTTTKSNGRENSQPIVPLKVQNVQNSVHDADNVTLSVIESSSTSKESVNGRSMTQSSRFPLAKLDRNQIPVNSEMKPMNGREVFIFKQPNPVTALKRKNQGNVQPIVPSKVQKVQNLVHDKITKIPVNAGMEHIKSEKIWNLSIAGDTNPTIRYVNASKMKRESFQPIVPSIGQNLQKSNNLSNASRISTERTDKIGGVRKIDPPGTTFPARRKNSFSQILELLNKNNVSISVARK